MRGGIYPPLFYFSMLRDFAQCTLSLFLDPLSTSPHEKRPDEADPWAWEDPLSICATNVP